MTPSQIAEAVARLDAISGGDPEGAHDEADSWLLYYADSQIADAYRRVIERCSWWATA